MSRTIRLTAAVLVISTFACGSLQALPVTTWAPLSGDRGNVFMVIVEWVRAIFGSERTDSPVPSPVQPKEGSIMDPDGNH